MSFDHKHKWVVLTGGLIATSVLAAIDLCISWDISLSLFYVVNIGIASYYGGLRVGIIIALASAASWTATNMLTGFPYVHRYAPHWNAGMRSVMFILFAYMTTRLKNEARLELFATTDSLTGVWNRRYFYERANEEIGRAGRYRHAFTIIYLDLDNFKIVNDTLGHQAGDDLLRIVAKTVRADLRSTDCFGRLGGDEFAVLLPETDQELAGRVLERMTQKLLEAMREKGCNVTFSVGAVTYLDPPNSVDSMINDADRCMYSVKRDGKNNIKHEIFSIAAATT